jgi:hypothetical protein
MRGGIPNGGIDREEASERLREIAIVIVAGQVS